MVENRKFPFGDRSGEVRSRKKGSGRELRKRAELRPLPGFGAAPPFGQENSTKNRLLYHPLQIHRTAIFTLILAGVALLSALIAPQIASSSRLSPLFLVAIFGLVAVLIILQMPILGIVGLIPAALMFPVSLSTGTGSGLNGAILLLLLLIGLWMLDMIARQHQVRLLNSRSVIVSIVFGVIALVSFLFGQYSWYPTNSAPLAAQIAGLMMYILSIGTVLLVGHQVNSIRGLQWMTGVFLAIGSVYIIARFIPPFQRNIYEVFARHATLGCLFYVWFAAIGVSQAIFNHELSRWLRYAIGGMMLAVAYLNLGESRFWMSGWLPALVGVTAILVLAKPRFGIWVVSISAILIIINTQVVDTLMSEGDNAYSTLTRLEAWKVMFQLIKTNPIFGLGMANYYWYTHLYPILGYSVSFSSHNNYIDLVAQTGLIGLIGFFWLMGELGWLGWKLKSVVPEGFPRAYVYGAIGGLAGTLFAGLLGDWFIPFVYNIGLEGFRASMLAWLFLGGLLVLEKLYITPSGDQPRGFTE